MALKFDCCSLFISKCLCAAFSCFLFIERVLLSSTVEVFITVTSLPKASAFSEIPCGVETFPSVLPCCPSGVSAIKPLLWMGAPFSDPCQAWRSCFVVGISVWTDEAAEGYTGLGLCGGRLSFSTADSSGHRRWRCSLRGSTPVKVHLGLHGASWPASREGAGCERKSSSLTRQRMRPFFLTRFTVPDSEASASPSFVPCLLTILMLSPKRINISVCCLCWEPCCCLQPRVPVDYPIRAWNEHKLLSIHWNTSDFIQLLSLVFSFFFLTKMQNVCPKVNQ